MCISRRVDGRLVVFFVFKQKTAYELRISDWSSDVCSSDLVLASIAQPMTRKQHANVLLDGQPAGWPEPDVHGRSGLQMGGRPRGYPLRLPAAARRTGHDGDQVIPFRHQASSLPACRGHWRPEDD